MTSKSTIELLNILLVEDNPGDIRLTQEVFKGAKIGNELYVARDGVEALDFLYQRGKFADVPKPDLILLDLNLPKKDGRDVLEEIKNDPDLRHIPVIVLTTSEAEQDIIKMYNLHANSYITKPVDPDQFISIIQNIKNFWLTIVKLSPGDS